MQSNRHTLEERYQTLFNSIDEGFCIYELLYDEHGKPSDYIFHEVNPAFEKQTGIKNAVGRRMREIAPSHEDYWYEIYGNVLATGKSIRFTKHSTGLNRWFDVYAFPVNGKNRLAAIFTDATERQNAEAAQHKQQEEF